MAITNDIDGPVPPDLSPAQASTIGRLSPQAWGYLVWGVTAAIIAVPELWAVSGSPRWPTISSTVAHLEALWSPTKAIVVALISAVVVHLMTSPPNRPPRSGERTALGRMTRVSGAPDEPPIGLWYLPLAVLLTAVAGAVTAALTDDRFVLGYVLYGTMALVLVALPNALAYWWRREVPFPTLFRTLGYLDTLFHPALVLVCSLLAVLVVHIVAFPWP